MSDALILGLATIISATVIAPVVAYMIRRSEIKIIKKVDTYHEEVNGNMKKLIETTKNLGRAEGKAQEKEDAKNKKK